VSQIGLANKRPQTAKPQAEEEFDWDNPPPVA
jgi:hypothetical protein